MTTTDTFEVTSDVADASDGPRARRWLRWVVERRMKRSLAKARAKREAGAYAGVAPEERARRIVRRACAEVAVTGALSGAITTAAIVATAETDGIGGVVILPLAAVAVAGEMVVREVVHVDLACELAEVFGVRFDDSDDIARLLSLSVGAASRDERDDLGMSEVKGATVDLDALVERAAYLLLGESVLRNLLPFVGIVSSAVTNVVVTYRLGQTLRRSLRYERALLDALRDAEGPCATCMDLLIEGLWFVFIADGRLSPEETACLAQRLDDLDAVQRREVLSRFTVDESDWMERIRSVPEGGRDTFLRVLEVAAALDKSFVLPEEKIIRRVADVFHRAYDRARVEHLVHQIETSGVLA